MRRTRRSITESYNALCFHNFVNSEPEKEPELPTNVHWRELMAATRKKAGLSQEELGRRVDATQVSISKIESGETASSTYIRPICRELSIPLPEHFVDEEQRRFWSELSIVQRNNPDQYRAVLDLVHSIAVGKR